MQAVIYNELRTKQFTQAVFLSNVQGNTGFHMQCMNIDTGPLYNERIGKQVYVKTIEYRVNMINPSPNDYVYRVILFTWRENSAIFPIGVSSVLDTTYLLVAGFTPVDLPYYPDESSERSKYTLLDDRIMPIYKESKEGNMQYLSATIDVNHITNYTTDVPIYGMVNGIYLLIMLDTVDGMYGKLLATVRYCDI